MEFAQKTEGFSEQEEEEELDEEEKMENFACNFFPRNQMIQDDETSRSSRHQAVTATEGINFHGKLQLTELSLRIESGGSEGGEREHMFDKVVTPSDVGKLNRLVIPKQHAEKYFPLDSSTNEKGLILNFEDPNGKPWRFRYSYWNSSQSYVMTKGWSRFVKDKKLDAGDIVSFHRGRGEFGKDRFFIEWRRRPDAPPPTHFTNPYQLPNPLLLLPQSLRWGGRQSQYTAPPPPRHTHYHHEQLPHMIYSNIHPNYSSNLGTSNLQYYLRGSGSSYRVGTMQQFGGASSNSEATHSVPVDLYDGNKTSSGAGTATAAKRLRLFGVNMECPPTDEEHPPTIQTLRRGKSPSSFNWGTSQSNGEF